MKNNQQRPVPVVMRKRQPILGQREILIRGMGDLEQRMPLPDFPESDNLLINLITGEYRNNGLLAAGAFTDHVFWEYRYRVITYSTKLAAANKVDLNKVNPQDPPDGAVEWEMIYVIPKRMALSNNCRQLLMAILSSFVNEPNVITLIAECKMLPRSYSQIKPRIEAGHVLDDQYFDIQKDDIYNITYTADIDVDLNNQLLLAPSLSAHI